MKVRLWDMDEFLKKYMARYSKWLDKDQIDFSSKVIPVAESVEIKQWIIPDV